jgi:hypothetical protein
VQAMIDPESFDSGEYLATVQELIERLVAAPV